MLCELICSQDLSLPQGVLNFVQYKFSHLAPKERQTMYELSKMFLLCLNYWKLETPSQFRQRAQKEDAAAYKVDYTRYVYYVVNKCMFVDYILRCCNKWYKLHCN